MTVIVKTSTWYRMAGDNTYHHPSHLWVEYGEALCGRSIPNPGFFTDVPRDSVATFDRVKLCSICKKRLMKEMKDAKT